MIAFSLIAVLITASSQSVLPSRFGVYQLIPRSDKDLQALNDLYMNSNERLDFWRAPSSVNSSVEIMVSSDMSEELLSTLNELGIEYKLVIEDVAELIRTKEAPLRSDRRSHLFEGRRLRDDRSFGGDLLMGDYYSYARIVQWLRNLQDRRSDIVRLIALGFTRENKIIYGVKIGAKHDNSSRAVWIDGGIHAREWAAVHTALYFIQQLVSGYGTDEKITDYVNNLDIYIFPCLNPDGYEFTRSDPQDPAIRMWRKNMSPEKCAVMKNGRKRCCKGVDLNRNFAFRFAEIGSSSMPCSEIHHGEFAFSEPESKAVRDAVLSLSNRLDAFITLHTYSQLWIYPFSHKKFAYSSDINDLRAVARKAVASLSKLYGTQYRYGTGPEIIYPFTGGSTDWAKESAHVKYSYTIELRPSYFDWNGFVLDRNQLVPTGKETFEGVRVVIEKVIEEDRLKRGIRTQPLLRRKCADVSPACAAWIANNPSVCRQSRRTMEVECRRSCSLCGPSEIV